MLFEVHLMRTGGGKLVLATQPPQPTAPLPNCEPTPDRIDHNAGFPAFTPRITRAQMAEARAFAKMPPATFHYQDPPDWMLHNPMFEAIWDEIKTWDVNVPTEYTGYMGATGNHAAAILFAIKDRVSFDGRALDGTPVGNVARQHGTPA
jgi:hypothetical protein